MGDVQWRCEAFNDLTARSLYRLMQLRAQVFVVEQRCVYLDPDGLDEGAWHLQATGANGQLLAYARLLPPHVVDDSGAARIGRVITSSEARGQGMGRQLMQQALDACARQWPQTAVELGAQAHLREFYGSFGFSPISDVYDEDGIPHIDMRRPPGQ